MDSVDYVHIVNYGEVHAGSILCVTPPNEKACFHHGGRKTEPSGTLSKFKTTIRHFNTIISSINSTYTLLGPLRNSPMVINLKKILCATWRVQSSSWLTINRRDFYQKWPINSNITLTFIASKESPPPSCMIRSERAVVVEFLVPIEIRKSQWRVRIETP